MTSPLAGRLCTIKVGGTPTVMTGEATSEVGAVCTITDATKRAIDPNTAITVYDGVGDESATASVDYVNGVITLAEAPAGQATITAKYIPLLTVAQAKSVDIQLPAPVIADVTLLGDTAQRSMVVAQKCSMTLAHFHGAGDDLDTGGGTFLFSALLTGAPIFVEVATSTAQTLRGWFVPKKADWKHGLNDAMEGSLELEGVVQSCVGRPSTEQALFSLTLNA